MILPFSKITLLTLPTLNNNTFNLINLLNMIKKIVIVLLIAVFHTLIGGKYTVMAQDNQTDIQLAFSYYNDKEYDKAAPLFINLFNSTKARVYFTYYIECLMELQNYEKAEKEVKKQFDKKNPDYTLYVQLGYIMRETQESDQAKAYFDDVIKHLPSDKNQIIGIATQFLRINEGTYAEQTYLKGRQITGYDFSFEIANLYGQLRKYPEMIDEYLNLLELYPQQFETVQANFTYFITSDINNEFSTLLRTTLLKRIQKTNLPVFTEILTWYYVQQKDFKNAFTQAKSLDKRNLENGYRMFRLGELARDNSDFQTAYNCFNYVVEKGRLQPHYYNAKYGLINVLYLQVSQGMITTLEQIKNLEQSYLETIEEFGITPNTVNMIRDLAHLEAFYLNKTPDAVTLLNQAIAIPGITDMQKGIMQIELGDIQLLQNDIWAATLTYARAENSNKTNNTGDEAKLKKAKIAYYTGNFRWALSQLDVLKASTSKLIANDALELAQIIKDNSISDKQLADDSVLQNANVNQNAINKELKMFARADLLISQQKDSLAIVTFDSLITLFKTHRLVDEAIYKKAQIYERKGNFTAAAENYNSIITDFSYDILADKAMYYLALLYEIKLNNQQMAMDLYKRLMQDYQGSVFIPDARTRYRNLQSNKL